MTGTREPGRREANKADKQRRIRQAARELFSARGYSSVTTQEVADLAQVGTGTLFRYAKSKGELLCMFANEDLRLIVETPPATGHPLDDLITLCEPLFVALESQPENIVAYHRQTLFGEPGPHREAAQQILRDLRDSIGQILARHVAGGAGPDDLSGRAQTVFDIMYMSIVRSGVDRARHPDPRGELRRHVQHVLHGVLPAAPATAPISVGAGDES